MTDYNSPAPVGHNQPPEETLDEQAKRAIDDALVPLRARFDKLFASAGRAAIVDQETAGKVTDLLAMFSNLEGSLNRAHADAKEPYLTAGRVVDGISAGLRDQIRDVRKTLNDMLTKWQQDEAARIEAIRAAQRAEEADDPVPAAEPEPAIVPAKVVTRGDMGARASLTKVLQIDKVDVKKLPKAFLERAAIMAVIETEAKKVIRDGGKVTGVTSSMGTKSSVRRGG